MSFIEMSAGRAATRGCPARTDSLLARLRDDLRWVSSVAPAAWTHGDLTFDNGLRGPGGVVLIDPLPSARPWAMDAAWCDVASGVESTPQLVPILASARHEIGLPAAADDDLERLATLSLAWASVLAWAMWPRDEPWWIESTSAHIDALSSL